MADLPASLLNIVYSLVVEGRSLAFLLVAKNGSLVTWGGAVEAYGMGQLQKGQKIGEQVIFLEGFLPLDGPPLLLPCVEVGPGLFADVYVGQGDGGDWVLLLDATADEMQRRRMQQKVNDLSLLREKLSDMLEQPPESHFSAEEARQVFTFEAEGARCEISVLSARIQGFRSYSEETCPESVFKTLNLCLRALVRPIRNEAGLLSQVGGDALTAVFGVLPAGTSPAIQAIQAAFDMMESIQEIAPMQLEQPAFGIGIGLASGPAVVGFVGRRERRSFTAIGRQVDVAARLERRTRPGEILIDEHTFSQIGDFQPRFTVRPLCLSDVDKPIQTFSSAR